MPSDFRNELQEFFENQLQSSSEYVCLVDDELHSAVQKLKDPSIKRSPRPLPSIMRAIEFRARVQSSFFTITYRLADDIDIQLYGLLEPMHLTRVDNNSDIMDVITALHSFELVHKTSDGSLAKELGINAMVHPSGLYAQPILWLATLIVRGAVVTDLWTMFDRMTCFGELGPIDVEKLKKAWPEDRLITVNRNAG